MDAILPAGDERVINATLPESDNYEGWSDYRTIKVNPAQTTITWENPADIVYGTLLDDGENGQLNATASAVINGETVTVSGVWTYTPAKNTKLDAGENQELKVQFTSTDNNFTSVEETKAYINVNKAKPEIVWEPQNVTYGASSEEIAEALKNAEAKFNGISVNGNYDYILPQTTDLEVGLEEGDIIAVVTFTPTGDDADNFEDVSTSVNVVVDKADPTITWEIADEDKTFTYGTALSNKQLNATSNGVGEFVYTEGGTEIADGTTLDAGTHTQSPPLCPNQTTIMRHQQQPQ